jgi:trans-o-hydroxybenzylidenepyruvate hydratase-aldolase
MAAKRKLLTAEEIHGVWSIIPTPAKDNASDWRAQDTVDVDETARAVEGLIAAGVDGILSLGTLGECATLTWEEKKAFISTVVETVRGRVPYFAGTTSLNTRETIRQTREAYDMGATGTMLGLPMWCEADVPTALQFYRDVAEACPEMAICIYANATAFRFPFPPPFWAQVCEIPQVVTVKAGGSGRMLSDYKIAKKRIKFLPIDIDYYSAARVDPDFFDAFWSSGTVCGPLVSTRFRDEIARAKATNEWSKAEHLSDEIMHATGPMFPRGNLVEFGKHNVGIEKARINAGGWMKAGPIRPPHHVIPEEYLQGARTAGEMWAALERKLKAES